MDNRAHAGERPRGQLADMPTLRRLFREKIRVSPEQAAAVLGKHGLGSLHSMQPLPSNCMNAIVELTPAQGNPVILKIQYRSGGGALEDEHYTINLLRMATALPVSDLCLLDPDKDVLPHPYLLSSRLPGAPARTFFEQADDGTRAQLAEAFGRVVGVIHGAPVPQPPRLGTSDLTQWRRIVEGVLWRDEELREEIAALSSAFYTRLTDLMEAVAVPLAEEEPVLLWGDASLDNLLVHRDSTAVRVAGLFDFQMASYGSRLFDLLRIERDFQVRHPREVYGSPAYVEHFYRGYRASGATPGVSVDAHRLLVEAVSKARTVRYWWDSARLLHPQTPVWLEDILDRLEQVGQVEVEGNHRGSASGQRAALSTDARGGLGG